MVPVAAVDEGIVLPDAPLIDAHHHFIERADLAYTPQDYVVDVQSGHRVVASVYAEMMTRARIDGPAHLRFLGEIEYARDAGETAAVDGIAAAIIGRVDLVDPRVAEALDAASDVAGGRFRGVRQLIVGIPAGSRIATETPARADLLAEPPFRHGARRLADRGLVLDVGATCDQTDAVRDLARALPELVIVVNHMAPYPFGGTGRSRDDFDRWASALRAVAGEPNVRCKIGGLGMGAWGFPYEPGKRLSAEELARLWRPYIRSAVDAFGPERCMMESNFPTDAGATDYRTLWNALKLSVLDMTGAEIDAVLRATAKSTYRL